MPDSAVSVQQLASEAHVWLTRPEDVDDPDRLAHYLDLLSDDERARYDRFYFDVHRKLYLVSHALVRTTLSRYADLEPAQWKFEEGQHGRPEIDPALNAAGLRFNLSHTENLAACIVCSNRDCGVDVERLNRVKDLAGVAHRVLTPPEREDLESHQGDALQGRFTDYWTLKEAYMKARGMGFQLPPETFAVDLSSTQAPRLDLPPDCDDEAADWQLDVRVLNAWEEPAYRLGIAIRHQGPSPLQVVVRETTPD